MGGFNRCSSCTKTSLSVSHNLAVGNFSLSYGLVMDSLCIGNAPIMGRFNGSSSCTKTSLSVSHDFAVGNFGFGYRCFKNGLGFVIGSAVFQLGGLDCFVVGSSCLGGGRFSHRNGSCSIFNCKKSPIVAVNDFRD